MVDQAGQDSYTQTPSRSDAPHEAAPYATRHGGHRRDRREQACVAAALRACDLPRDAAVLALTELARITLGPLIAPFCNSFAVDAVKFRVKYTLAGRTPDDRVPIPVSTFTADARAAGLQIKHSFPARRAVSPLWYVLLQRS
jgi:hypothetical protein